MRVLGICQRHETPAGTTRDLGLFPDEIAYPSGEKMSHSCGIITAHAKLSINSDSYYATQRAAQFSLEW